MLEKALLKKEFKANLNKIASEFINLFDLSYKQEIERLSDPILRWLDFRFRYIVPRPRQIVYSVQFPKKFSNPAKNAINLLVKKIIRGEDINAYQGKGLTLHNDTSGKKTRSRTDLLWADWGIIHLHLTNRPISKKQYFSARSEWLLFCIAGEDFVAFIDVCHHKEKNIFSNPRLVEIVAENWPELMEKHRLKGSIKGSNSSYSADDIFTLRKKGVTNFITIDKKVYMPPGFGITSACTSSKIAILMIHICRYIEILADMICQPGGQFQNEVSNVECPHFTLQLTAQGMVVYETHSNKAFVLPKNKSNTDIDYLVDLQELISPSWALNAYLNSINKKQ